MVGCTVPVWRFGVGCHSGSSDDGSGGGGDSDVRSRIAEVGRCDGDE